MSAAWRQINLGREAQGSLGTPPVAYVVQRRGKGPQRGTVATRAAYRWVPAGLSSLLVPGSFPALTWRLSCPSAGGDTSAPPSPERKTCCSPGESWRRVRGSVWVVGQGCLGLQVAWCGGKLLGSHPTPTPTPTLHEKHRRGAGGLALEAVVLSGTFCF